VTALKLDLSPAIFGAALVATVVAIAGAAWFVTISPRHSDATKLETAIQADQTRLSAAAHLQQVPKAAAKAKAASVSQVKAALPDELAMPQVVDQLNRLALEAGVTLDTVTPAAATVGIGYESVPLTVVVDGQFFGVKRFLQLMRTQVSIAKAKVHASGRLFDVQGFQLNQTEPAPAVSATINMEAFYFAPTAGGPVTGASTDTTETSTTPSG
jgi:Tfp pilus assembly protein PilO